MSKLPTISTLLNDAAQLESALLESNGEITPEIEQLLAVRETNIPTKIEQYKYRIDRFRMVADYLKSQQDKLRALQKSFDSAADRIEDGLLNAMEAHGVEFLDGLDFEAQIKLNPPAVIIEDESAIPEEFKTFETITKIDKNSIKAVLKTGPVPGAVLDRSKKVVFKPMAKKAVTA